MALRSADSLLETAVRATVDALALDDTDRAAARLALAYAQAIDAEPETLEKLGPRLKELLDALLATPGARAKLATNNGQGLTAHPSFQALQVLRGAAG